VKEHRSRRPAADLRAIAQAAWRAGVAAVDPRDCVARRLALRGDLHPDSPSTLVVAVGKAAAAMMRGALPVARGFVLCPGADCVTDLPGCVEVLGGGHPEPTLQGLDSSRRIAAAVAALEKNETLLFLLSGGASSLFEVGAAELRPEDLIAAHRALVVSGAPISDINRVRCCLSAVKGGALAALAAPAARVCTLAVSDVVGDDPAAIGSGPTYPAQLRGGAAARAALDIVARYAVRMPPGVSAYLEAMARSVRDGGAADANWRAAGAALDYEIVAGIDDAIAGAARFLQARGCEVSRHREPLTGETTLAAAQVAQQLTKMHPARGARQYRSPPSEVGSVQMHPARGARQAGVGDSDGRDAEPALCAWLAGGETTVAVPPGCKGRGGRNLDLAARLALAVAGRAGLACAIAGTDGRDGNSRAAGAVIDGGTAARAAAAGLPLGEALAAFDTEPALEAAGDSLVTGATGTNVGDLLVAVTAQ